MIGSRAINRENKSISCIALALLATIAGCQDPPAQRAPANVPAWQPPPGYGPMSPPAWGSQPQGPFGPQPPGPFGPQPPGPFGPQLPPAYPPQGPPIVPAASGPLPPPLVPPVSPPGANSGIARDPSRPANGTVANAGSVVGAMGADFRRCYSVGLNQDANMEGSVQLETKIGAKGEVVDVSPRAVTGLSKEVVACLAETVKKATFSPPEGGSATIAIPVTFKIKQ